MKLGSIIKRLELINDSISGEDADVMFVPDGILSEAIRVCSVQSIFDPDGKNIILLGAYPINVGA